MTGPGTPVPAEDARPAERELLERVPPSAWSDPRALVAALDDAVGDGAAAVVKRGVARTVVRVRGDGADLHVKVHHPPRVRDAVKDAVRGPRGALEAERLARARRRDLPVPRPVAWGDDGADVLVTATILDADGAPPPTLEERIERAEQARAGTGPPATPPAPDVRRAWCTGLARLAARLHDAGLRMPDLHAGNVLAGDDGTVHLVDAWTLVEQATAPLPDGPGLADAIAGPGAGDDLAALGMGVFAAAVHTDRARFWATYLAARGGRWDRADRHAAARTLERRILDAARRHWAERDARARGGNRHVARARGWGRPGAWWRGLPEATVRALVCGEEPPPALDVLKDGRTARVLLVDLEGTPDATLPDDAPREPLARPGRAVLKDYRHKKLLQPLWDAVRGGRARRGFARAWAMHVRGLAAPRPLGWAEDRRFGLVFGSSLLVEALPGVPLDRALAEGYGPALPDARRRLLTAVGRRIRALHERGLAHRDLKPQNLIVHPAGPPRAGSSDASRRAEPPLVSVVDFDGLRVTGRPPSAERRRADLARLLRDMTDADAEAVRTAYRDVPPRLSGDLT